MPRQTTSNDGAAAIRDRVNARLAPYGIAVFDVGGMYEIERIDTPDPGDGKPPETDAAARAIVAALARAGDPHAVLALLFDGRVVTEAGVLEPLASELERYWEPRRARAQRS